MGKNICRAVSFCVLITFFAVQLQPIDFVRAEAINTHTLTPSLISDASINPERADSLKNDISKKLEPGAIANGKPLLDLVQGKLPEEVSDYDPAVLDKIRKAIEFAAQKFKSSTLPTEYMPLVKPTGKNLAALYTNLTQVASLFNAVVLTEEDYNLGFNYEGKIGLSIELVELLPVELLAQYIFHECMPESHSLSREDHREHYEKIQTRIFGEQEVKDLGAELRRLIDQKAKGHSVITLKEKRGHPKKSLVLDPYKLQKEFNFKDGEVAFDVHGLEVGLKSVVFSGQTDAGGKPIFYVSGVFFVEGTDRKDMGGIIVAFTYDHKTWEKEVLCMHRTDGENNEITLLHNTGEKNKSGKDIYMLYTAGGVLQFVTLNAKAGNLEIGVEAIVNIRTKARRNIRLHSAERTSIKGISGQTVYSLVTEDAATVLVAFDVENGLAREIARYEGHHRKENQKKTRGGGGLVKGSRFTEMPFTYNGKPLFLSVAEMVGEEGFYSERHLVAFDTRKQTFERIMLNDRLLKANTQWLSFSKGLPEMNFTGFDEKGRAVFVVADTYGLKFIYVDMDRKESGSCFGEESSLDYSKEGYCLKEFKSLGVVTNNGLPVFMLRLTGKEFNSMAYKELPQSQIDKLEKDYYEDMMQNGVDFKNDTQLMFTFDPFSNEFKILREELIDKYSRTNFQDARYLDESGYYVFGSSSRVNLWDVKDAVKTVISTVDTKEKRTEKIEPKAPKSGKEAILNALSDSNITFRAQLFQRNLVRMLSGLKDQEFILAVDTEIGSNGQDSQMAVIYSAIERLEKLREPNGEKLFPNLTVVRGKGSTNQLGNEVAKRFNSMNESGKKIGAVFMVMRNSTLKTGAYKQFEDHNKIWISAIEDMNATDVDKGDYLPVFEAALMSIMAATGADAGSIKRIFDSIGYDLSGNEVTEEQIEAMINTGKIIILPKAAKIDLQKLGEIYERVRDIYIAA